MVKIGHIGISQTGSKRCMLHSTSYAISTIVVFPNPSTKHPLIGFSCHLKCYGERSSVPFVQPNQLSWIHQISSCLVQESVAPCWTLVKLSDGSLKRSVDGDKHPLGMSLEKAGLHYAPSPQSTIGKGQEPSLSKCFNNNHFYRESVNMFNICRYGVHIVLNLVALSLHLIKLLVPLGCVASLMSHGGSP